MSLAGTRVVPIPNALFSYLVERKLALGYHEGLLFGRDCGRPFQPTALRKRALTAWKHASLDPITLHEARHTYASLLISSGANPKSVATYMGHSSITITYDRYGHLMPGNEIEAADLLDNYLIRSRDRATLADRR